MLHAQNGATDAKSRHDEYGHMKQGNLGDFVKLYPRDKSQWHRIRGLTARFSPEMAGREMDLAGDGGSVPDLAGSLFSGRLPALQRALRRDPVLPRLPCESQP